MAIRNIRIDEDPILKKLSKEVTKFDDRNKILIEDMYDTMYKFEGVGLAAVQVGILKRIIVIDDREEHKMTLINPKIIKKEGIQVGVEGCLSLPKRQGTVERYKNIIVKYQDENGTEKEIEAEDFFAVILQHEIDHLDGILYSQRAKEVHRLVEELEG